MNSFAQSEWCSVNAIRRFLLIVFCWYFSVDVVHRFTGSQPAHNRHTRVKLSWRRAPRRCGLADERTASWMPVDVRGHEWCLEWRLIQSGIACVNRLCAVRADGGSLNTISMELTEHNLHYIQLHYIHLPCSQVTESASALCTACRVGETLDRRRVNLPIRKSHDSAFDGSPS